MKHLLSSALLGVIAQAYDENGYADSDGEVIDILDAVYEGFRGHHWDMQFGWDDKHNLDFCNWHGVTCNEDGDIEEIDLMNNNLNGALDIQVFNIKSLKVLSLSDNPDAQFSLSKVPNNLSSLRRLNVGNLTFDDDGLDGITQLDFQNFRGLDASRNAITGKIPEEIFNFESMDILYIDRNELTGTISEKIGQLESLVSFDVFGNSLTGSLPHSIGNLKNIKFFEISHNSLSGSVPWNEVDKWSHLEGFYAHNNGDLTGTVPTLGAASKLQEVRIGNNKFTGSIPKSFMSASPVNQEAEIMIHLEDNLITGAVPSTFSRFPVLDLRLENNQIDALPDSFCEMENWMGGQVGKYGCDAILCKPGEGNKEGRETDSKTPCVACPGSTFFGGTTCLNNEQASIEREVLKLFFQSCGGSEWLRKEGWMDDATPICNWEGIGCHNDLVEVINLGANNVVGTPPKRIFTDLPNLKSIVMYSNPLEDFSFDGIAEATRLTSVILDSTGLKSIKGIGEAPSLELVNLRFNQISENSALEEVAKLDNLVTLDLGDNLIPGTIPSSFETSLRKVHKLYLGRNKLEGSLPTLNSHTFLSKVDFSYNKFSGVIPDDFMELSPVNKDVLINLAENDITGEIPLGLARFDSLDIYLRNNNIKGFSNILCEQKSWNGGDVDIYKCNAIMCPVGTYSQVGRQTNEHDCKSCDKVKTSGATEC
eukprot:CAMPEP_0116065872 /NCGR_PEP_ID=MMETSP0322-20121206/10043_1 /TAXON_ID=163516 /ORGANISM="Leptocylindrus danicus var. apora, Strain B651" /LENGTH=705 /DNA_ID=CAMNT_0003552313 /DNA_START=232 /DNA_END=2349 /DNA_ORIENTATION=+